MSERNEFTYRLLKQAGITEGMRVLDVGCGPGEVTALVREMVGPSGEVIGVDLNEQLLNLAEEHNIYQNVSFKKADIYQLGDDLGYFDAVVGRRVLMYLPDAVEALKSVKRCLRENGLVVFQESDAVNANVGTEHLPLHRQAIDWVWETISREGGNIHMGHQLYTTYIAAGLAAPEMMSEGVIQTTNIAGDLPWLIAMMHDRIVKHGVATAKDIEIDTLEQRMALEREQTETSFIRDMAFGAWSRQ